MKTALYLALVLGLNSSAFGQSIPAWFPKAPPLAEPMGNIVRASTDQQILELGERLEPNTTLVIEPGIYRLDRPLVLRQKQNITIRSASGDPASVTIQGKGWEAGNDREDLIHVGNCTNVTIAGITFAEARSYGVKVQAEDGPRDIHIYNCRFRNIGVRAIKGSAGNDPEVRAVRGSVRFCDFENTKVPPANWLFDGDYISAIDMMALDKWIFSDNTFRDIKGRNGGGRAAIFIWVRSRNVLLQRNWIFNCDRGIAFGNPGQSTANKPGEKLTYVADSVIQNNMITGGADCGIELWHVDGIKVLHNSIWRPERNFGRGIRIGTGATNTLVQNNLVHGGIQLEGGDAQVITNLAKRLDEHFVNATAGDLALVKPIELSAAPAVPYDIHQIRRTALSDLGAWEHDPLPTSYWIEPMRKEHSRFKGTPGTLLQIGDSITFSGAYWSALAGKPK
ncbi:MAG TPA: right-handed parallel beta-helix repeat-containing protein, partial [Verrucomicrobiae bacterium]|nr:right-handed parallel beta-helix repeat-containing protein [Verrucomicrobiae bacterium]